MQFTLVIFSTYEFLTESLASAKLAPSFFMSNKALTYIESCFVSKSNFHLKDFFFTSPQLKNTLFKTASAQLIFMLCFLFQAIIRLYHSTRKGNV